MKMRNDLTSDRLREKLHYDPNNGQFHWRRGGHFVGSVKAGQLAGTVVTGGYISIGIDQKYYKAHRLAWLYVYGVWPSYLVDHIDGDTANNRISNLREATSSQNQVNRRRHRVNKTGFRGVSMRNGEYYSQPNFNGQRHFLGSFKTAEEAHKAYTAFWAARGGEFLPRNRVPVTPTETNAHDRADHRRQQPA